MARAGRTTPVWKVQDAVEAGASPAAPIITSLDPTSGPLGTWVTVRGANFTSENNVEFRRGPAAFRAGSPAASEDGVSLRFQVTSCPSYEPRCPARYVVPGLYKVRIINSNGESNEADFDLTVR
jgi:hypothetical protein